MRFRSAKVLSPADAGKRVTVRRRLPDGSASDVLGILTQADPTTLTIRRADGSLVEVATEDVIAARVIG